MSGRERYDDREQYEAALALVQEEREDKLARGLIEKLGDHYVDGITLNCDEHDFLCAILETYVIRGQG